MIVEKPIDHATVLLLENQIAIMHALAGSGGTLRAHIDSTEAAIDESNRLRRLEAEHERAAWLRG